MFPIVVSGHNVTCRARLVARRLAERSDHDVRYSLDDNTTCCLLLIPFIFVIYNITRYTIHSSDAMYKTMSVNA